MIHAANHGRGLEKGWKVSEGQNHTEWRQWMRKLIDMAERLRPRHEAPYDINLLQPIMLQEYSTTGHSLTAIRNLELKS